MNSKIKRLPDGELEIMQAVWACKTPAARADIEGALGKELAPTTVLTLLTRLCDKGFLRAEKEGKHNVYTPLIARRTYLAMESRGTLDRLYGGSLGAFAAALCDSGVTEEDLRELEELLRAHRHD